MKILILLLIVSTARAQKLKIVPKEELKNKIKVCIRETKRQGDSRADLEMIKNFCYDVSRLQISFKEE